MDFSATLETPNLLIVRMTLDELLNDVVQPRGDLGELLLRRQQTIDDYQGQHAGLAPRYI